MRHWQGRDHYDTQEALLQEGDPSVREVALTFDDGPDPRYGPAIAALLKQKNVPATFFLVGMRVKEHPEVARLLAADGFELANHTYNHQSLPALKPHEIANELRLCDQDIYAATGRHTTLMRPPGVQYNDKVLNVAKRSGLCHGFLDSRRARLRDGHDAGLYPGARSGPNRARRDHSAASGYACDSRRPARHH